MKLVRKIFFWCHLVTGVIAGLIILTMSITGVLLAFESQIERFADRGLSTVRPPEGAARRLSAQALLTKVQEARPEAKATSMTLQANPSAAASIALGREEVLYVNPYTGEVLGEGAKGVREFFHAVTDWHRWLGMSGENRSTARAITGACNLGFLFLVISGFYMWWPRNLTWAQVKNVIWFRRRLSTKARDFNWHNVIGFWLAIPLFIIVISGVVISYQWAGNLVYRLAGETPPAPRGGPGQGQGNNSPARGNGERRSEGPQGEGGPRRNERRAEGAPDAQSTRDRARDAGAPGNQPLDGLDQLWSRAEQQMTAWQSISLRLPNAADAAVTFTIDQGERGQPQKRAQLTLDRKTGEIVRWEPFASYTTGRKLRSILRFAHTGEVIGIVGQLIAGLASLGSAVLVWTGLALALRRFRSWVARRSEGAIASRFDLET